MSSLHTMHSISSLALASISSLFTPTYINLCVLLNFLAIMIVEPKIYRTIVVPAALLLGLDMNSASLPGYAKTTHIVFVLSALDNLPVHCLTLTDG